MSLVVQMADQLKQIDDQLLPPSSAQSEVAEKTPDKIAGKALPLFAAADQLHQSQRSSRRKLTGAACAAVIAIVAATALELGWFTGEGGQVKNLIANIASSETIESSAVNESFEGGEQSPVAQIVAATESMPLASPTQSQKLAGDKPVADAGGDIVAALPLAEPPPASQAEIAWPDKVQPEVVQAEITQTTIAHAANTRPVSETGVAVVKNSQQPAVPGKAGTSISEGLAVASAVHKTASMPSLDEKLYLSAQELLDSSLNASALALLAETLDVEAGATYPQSAALYAALLLSDGQYNEAQNLLDRYRQAYPESTQFVKSQIRLAMARNDFAMAQQLLDRHSLPASVDMDYLVFQAAVYQSQQQWRQALQSYRQLLSLDQRRAESWMGLAIAHDAMGDSLNASKAYRSALATGRLDSNLHSYAISRIAAL